MSDDRQILINSVTAGVILGVLMSGFALFYYLESTQIKQKPGVVGAATVPYILAGIMGLLGVLQLWAGIKAVRSFEAEKRKQAEQGTEQKSDNVTLLLTIALIIAYLLLMEPLGFIIATFLYLFLQFTVLTPVDQKPKFWLYALLAAAVAIVVYLGFRYGLMLVLPQGLIKVV